jgi:uncharacterized protein (DUF58 family)
MIDAKSYGKSRRFERVAEAFERGRYNWRVRVTERGRYFFIVVGALGLLGLDTRRNLTFLCFGALFAMMAVASAFSSTPPPRAKLVFTMPLRGVARAPITLRAELTHLSTRDPRSLLVLFAPLDPWLPNVTIFPRATIVGPSTRPQRTWPIEATLTAPRRGSYTLIAPTVRALDPFQLYGTRANGELRASQLLITPAIFPVPELTISSARRYQAEGKPHAHAATDAVEFVGTRDYRPGDPVRNIHMRSWARRGAPVVKEHHEEFLARAAIVVDDSAPRPKQRPFMRPPAGRLDRGARAFEARISVAAGVAARLADDDVVVDRVSVGAAVHSLAHAKGSDALEGVLELLASATSRREATFVTPSGDLLAPGSGLSALILVLGDWDEARAALVRTIRDAGVEVTTLVVRDGETTRPIDASAGVVRQVSVADVERVVGDGSAAEPTP